MQQLLRFANEQYNNMDGCGDECDCQNCIRKPFYDSNGNEKYDCIKGLAYYVMDYGPCYASSTYHFFRFSHILQRIGKKKIKILSIGCGFSPDYYALKKIIQDDQLDIDIDYIGIEQSERWNIFHNQWETPNKKIENIDVLSKLIPNFFDFDIIIMDKFFQLCQIQMDVKNG